MIKNIFEKCVLVLEILNGSRGEELANHHLVYHQGLVLVNSGKVVASNCFIYTNIIVS
jgi:hypothetical protein